MLCLLGMASHGKVILVACSRRRLTDLFAWLLTRVDSDAAGRAYAAYGGIYICASLAWLWTVEGVRPHRWDVAGAALCLIGTCIILLGPRTA